MADALLPLLRKLHDRSVRFVLIGVAGANYYVVPGSPLFVTTDHDKDKLFLASHRDALAQLFKKSDR